MVAEPYIAYVKQRLNDTPDTQVHLGEHYPWQTVLLYLNEALLHTCHLALAHGVVLPLKGLMRQIGYPPPAPVPPAGYPLPPNFFWVASAQVLHSVTGLLIPARMLVGGSGLSYLYSGNNVCLLIANTLMFVDDTNTPTGGQLSYYVYPSPFSIAAQGRFDYTQKDFDDFFYDLVAEVTVAFLGANEGQNVREAEAWEKWWTGVNQLVLEALVQRNLSVLHTARVGD